MYQLEERILFDGAAPAAVADAAKQAAAEAAKAEPGKAEAAAQSQTERENNANSNPHDNNAKNMQVNPNPVTDQSTGIESYLAQAMNIDAAAPAVNHDSANAQAHVLVVSNSLEQSQAITSLADANTVVVKYDAQHTTAAQLLEQINQALGDTKADSIAFFAESTDNGQMQLFADGKTTATSIKDTAQQQFWHGIDGMLSSEGRIDLVGSNLAATEAGKMLVQEIANASGHEITASTDLTGSVDKGGNWIQEYSSASDTINNLDIASKYFDHNALSSFDGLLPVDHAESHQVAFINSSVMGADEITAAITNLGENVEIVMLDKGDAFAQITQYLQDKSNIDAIHIISHGNDGYFRLGDTTVNSDFVQTHQTELSAWGKSLTANGDIMLYGCNLAADADGKAFVQQLAHATGADIAASIDSTGAESNWTLEYHAGNIEAAGFVFNNYSYHLTNYTVNSVIDVPIGTLPDSVYTLRKAVTVARDGDEVIFAPWSTLTLTKPVGAADFTINLDVGLGQIEIAKNITINGVIALTSSTTRVIVDANPLVGLAQNRVFYINAVSDATNFVTFQNMIIQNGNAISSGSFEPSDGAGGGMYIDTKASLVLNEVDVRYNSAAINGGGIYTAGTLLVEKTNTLYGTDIYFNMAGNSGGGIFKSATGSLTVEGLSVNNLVDIYGNTATTGSGGGIYSYGDVLINKAFIYNNNANSGSGGGIAIENGSGVSTFNSVDLQNNRAINGGGISYTQGKSLNVQYSFIVSNDASGDGGGIYFANNSGDLYVCTTDGSFGANVHASFLGNTATHDGGAIYVDRSGTTTIDFVEFSSNIATGSGGAIYVQNSGNLSVNEGNFISNQSSVSGGGIYQDGNGSLTVTNSYFGTNRSGIGGAIYKLAGTLALTNSTYYINTASTNGGAVYLDSGTINAAFCTFAYNDSSSALGQGGVIYINNTAASNLSIVSSIILNNATPKALSQIWISGNTNVSSFTYNIYSDWYNDNSHNPANSLSLANISGAGNQVGKDLASSNAIKNTIYLANPNINANYRTYTMAIMYENSIAYTKGISVSGVVYDQRGNTRTGTGVTGASNSAPSVGAFEPIFYTTVNCKDDTSSMVFTSDASGHYFDIAKTGGGLTLREAFYWMDNYNRQAAFDSGNYNNNHYVKFDSTVFAAGLDNTITLNYGAIVVGGTRMGFNTSKEIAISSVAVIDPLDPRAYGDVNDPVAYRAQNAVDRITVNANNASGVFTFTSSAIVYLSNITATNGYNDGDSSGHGGGICNEGALILNNIVVSNSHANNNKATGAYYNTGYGGGIYNSGVVQMYDSTVTGNSVTAYGSDKYKPNSAGLGGGIYNSGNFTVERSTIDNNFATGQIQYVIQQSVAGGGIYSTGSLYVANTTIALNTLTATQALSTTGNIAGDGAGIYARSGSAYLYYNTIVKNHTEQNAGYVGVPEDKAAVSLGNSATLYIADTIVADNTVQIKAGTPRKYLLDIYVPTALTVDTTGNNSSYNVIGGFNSSVYDWSLNLTNHVGDAHGSVNNLNLDSVMLYNGAKTMTYRVMDGSVAAGNAIALTNFGQFTSLLTDQRTFLRNTVDRSGGTTPNIGSYESLVQITVNSSLDSGVNPVNKGYNFTNDTLGWVGTDVTLRDAVYWADSEAQITINPSVTSVQLNTQSISIIHGININTVAGPVLTITGDGANRIFVVENSDYLPLVSVALSNMVIQNGNASAASNSGHGGAIFSKETMTLNNVTVRNNTAAGRGGGIFSQGGNLTLNGSTISGNTAASGAGGIYSEANNLTISGSSILSNTATAGDGGGLFSIGSNMTVNNSTFGYNIASNGHGGAVYSNSSNLNMTNSTISQNQAALNGGGLNLAGGGTFNLTYVTIANNISGTANGISKYGGGLYFSAGNLSIIDSIIANNYSVNTSTHDDFYKVGGTVASATYNAVGASTGYTFAGAGNIVGVNGVIANLGLSSTLENNGGPTNTMTLYLAQTSVAASAGITVAETTSQNGKTRKASPSMGAYESRIDRYIYQGTSAGLVTDRLAWEIQGGVENPLSFDLIDTTFVFNDVAKGNGGATLNSVWNVSSRAVIEVSQSGDFIMNSAGSINSTRAGETVTINALETGSLSIGTLLVSQITLGTLDNTSTVGYIYAGNQTVMPLAAGNYGNLLFDGGGTKTALNALTVNGNLTFAGTANFTVNGALNAAGNVAGNGNISAYSVTIGTAGISNINLNGTISGSQGDVVLTGDSVTLGTFGIGNGNVHAAGGISVTGTSSIAIYSSNMADSVKTQNGNVNIAGGTIDIDGDIITGTSGNNISIFSVNPGSGITLGGDISTKTGTGASGNIGIYTNNGDIETNGIIRAAGNVTIGVDSAVLPTSIANNIVITGSVIAGNTNGTIFVQGSDITVNGLVGIADSITANDISFIANGLNFNGENITARNNVLFGNGTTNTAVFSGTNASATNSLTVNSTASTFNNSTMAGNAFVVLNSTAVLDNSTFTGSSINITGNISTNGTGTTSSFNSSVLNFDNNTYSLAVNSADTLAFNLGNQNVLIDNGTGPDPAPAVWYNVNNITVDSIAGSRLKIVTNGSLNLQNIVGTDADNIQGILSLTSPTLNLSQVGAVNFNNASFEFGGNILLGGAFSINNSIDFIGTVTLTGTDASVTSNLGYVKFSNTVTGTGQNLTVTGFNGVTFNNISGVNNLTAIISQTVGPDDGIILLGSVTGAGIFDFQDNVSVTGLNSSLSGNTFNFAGSLSGTGRISLSANGGTLNNLNSVFMNDGSELVLTKGSFTTNDNTLTAATLTIGSGASIDGGTGTMHLSGNLNNAGNLISNGTISFDGISRQNINLSGSASLHDVSVSNLAGVQLQSGKLTVLNDFSFSAGKFYIGSNIVEVRNSVIGAGESNYFVTDTNGTLRLMAFSGVSTDFWIGSDTYASMVSIQNNSPDMIFGVQTYGNVTGQATVNGQTILGIDSAVHRTWTISSDTSTAYDVVFAWNKGEEGVALGNIGDLSNYQVWHWVTVNSSPINDLGTMRSTGIMSLNKSGVFAVAAPGTNFDYAGSFKGLNDNNANSSGFSYPSMVVDVPMSQGELAYDSMEERLALNPLTNPLGVFIPATGTDAGAIYAGEVFTITGDSVYGTDGVYDANPDTDVEYILERNNDSRPSLEPEKELDNYFVELAEINLKMEKHPAFKTAVDNMLDKLMAG